MFRTRTLLPLAAAAALAVSTTGCDFLAEKLGVDKVTVPFGAAGQSLAISSTTATIKTNTVSRDGGTLPDVFDVESVDISPADIRFTPSTATKVAQSGVINFALVADGCIVGTMDITITNDVATSVSPRPVRVGSVNMTTYQSLVNKLPAAQRPSATTACTPAGFSATIRKSTFSASLLVGGTGSLLGSLGITQGIFNLDF